MLNPYFHFATSRGSNNFILYIPLRASISFHNTKFQAKTMKNKNLTAKKPQRALKSSAPFIFCRMKNGHKLSDASRLHFIYLFCNLKSHEIEPLMTQKLDLGLIFLRICDLGLKKCDFSCILKVRFFHGLKYCKNSPFVV